MQHLIALENVHQMIETCQYFTDLEIFISWLLFIALCIKTLLRRISVNTINCPHRNIYFTQHVQINKRNILSCLSLIENKGFIERRVKGK